MIDQQQRTTSKNLVDLARRIAPAYAALPKCEASMEHKPDVKKTFFFSPDSQSEKLA